MTEKSVEIASDETPVADLSFILNHPSTDEMWVEVPEWKSKVKIKSLTKAEQVKLRKASMNSRGVIDELKLEMNLLVFSMVEPRLTFDQVDELYTKSNPKAINRLQASCLTFSGLTEDYFLAAEADMKS